MPSHASVGILSKCLCWLFPCQYLHMWASSNKFQSYMPHNIPHRPFFRTAGINNVNLMYRLVGPGVCVCVCALVDCVHMSACGCVYTGWIGCWKDRFHFNWDIIALTFTYAYLFAYSVTYMSDTNAYLHSLNLCDDTKYKNNWWLQF